MDVEEFVLVPLSLWNTKWDKSTLDIEHVPKLEMSHGTVSSAAEEIDYNYKAEQDKQIKSKFTGSDGQKNNKKRILDMIRSNSNIEVSTNLTIILDGQDTNMFATTFINDLCKKKSPIPEIYFSILQRLKLPNSLVENEDALSTDRGGWLTF